MAVDLLGLSSIVSGRVSKEIEKKRWDSCKNCTFLIKYDRCKKCGCFMKAKVKFKGAKCPIGIWNKVEE
tara:strand:- start:2476 stop:2682 length:207 start_codon:yes stop_codon:yes gene_type:complete